MLRQWSQSSNPESLLHHWLMCWHTCCKVSPQQRTEQQFSASPSMYSSSSLHWSGCHFLWLWLNVLQSNIAHIPAFWLELYMLLSSFLTYNRKRWEHLKWLNSYIKSSWVIWYCILWLSLHRHSIIHCLAVLLYMTQITNKKRGDCIVLWSTCLLFWKDYAIRLFLPSVCPHSVYRAFYFDWEQTYFIVHVPIISITPSSDYPLGHILNCYKML